jgi:hypothetical protein
MCTFLYLKSDKRKKKKPLLENAEDEENGIVNPSMVS